MNFLETVKAMRETQKAYFKTRDKGLLIRSKELEKEVDNYLSNNSKRDRCPEFPPEKPQFIAHGGVPFSELS